jgi:hypothetical protein
MTHANRSRLGAAIALAIVAGYADALDCKKACAAPAGQLDAHATLDANTGRLIDGAAVFPVGTRVQVTIVNKNPFKYAYRLQVTTEPLSSAIISEFLGSIPGFKDLLPGRRAAPPGFAHVCSGAPKEYTDLFASISSTGTAANEAFQKSADYPDKFNAFKSLADVDVVSAPDQCEKMCSAAVDLFARRSAFDPATVDKAVDGFGSEIAANQDALAKLQNPDANKTCLAALKEAQKAAEARKAQADKTATQIKQKLTENQGPYRQMDRILEASIESADPFVESKFPVPSDDATAIRVDLFRRNLWIADAAETPVASVTLTVGRSRFSISGGIGVSSIPNVRYGRQPLVTGSGTTTTISTQIGYLEHSDFSAGLLVALNGMIASWKDVSWGVTTAVMVTNRNGEASVEYILAPLTLGFLKDQVFFTAGLHFAKVQELANGFSIGQEVPSGLQDPIPTTSRWKTGVIGALTYRIR